MKHVWQEIVGNFTRRERRVIAKRDFPTLLREARGKYKPEWATGGFKNAGVIPFNPQAISKEALKPSQVLEGGPASETDESSLTNQLQLGSDGNDPTVPPGPSAEMVVITTLPSLMPWNVYGH